MKKIILILLLVFSIKSFAQILPYKQWQQTNKVQIQNWNTSFNDSKLDLEGNLITIGQADSIAGNSYSKGAIITKFKKQGGKEWNAFNYGYHSNYKALRLNAMDIDSQNNIYVAGRSDSVSFFGKKASLYKYNPAGGVVWEKHIGVNPYYKEAGFADVVIDAQGNVIASGYVVTTSGEQDTSKLLLVKYNSAGTLIFSQIYNPQQLVYGNSKIAVDPSGNIFTFYEGRAFNNKNLVFITKFNASGTRQWGSTYQGDNFAGIDYVNDLKIGADNNPVLMATLNNAAPAYSTLQLIKLNTADGSQVFNQSYGVGFSSFDELAGNIVINSTNDIFFCYSSRSSEQTNYEGIIYKLNSGGGVQWVRMFNTVAAGGDYINNIAIDSESNIYAAAYSSPLIRNYIIKYDNAGNKKWETSYPTTSSYYYFSQISIGVNKEVYYAQTINPLTGAEGNAYKFIQINGMLTQPSKTTSKAITDFQDTYDTLTVSGIPSSAVILNMEIKFDSIRHSYPHDLTFHLTTPGGYKDSVIRNAGPFSAGTGFFRTTLTDTAAKIIDSSSSPFTGTFRPYRSMSNFNNQRVNGNWILRINDNALGDTGRVYKWGLVITYFDTLLTEIKTITTTNVPDGFYLAQNYPNPFNPSTKISFNIPKASNVTMEVYDITGRMVASLIDNKFYQTGFYTIDMNGASLSSGAYFYRITAGEFTETKKMLLLK